MKRKFLTHFLGLALVVFGLTYLTGVFIEKDKLKGYHNRLLLKSQDTTKTITSILTTKQIKNKGSAIQVVFNNLLDKEPAFSSYQLGKIKHGVFQPSMVSYKGNDSVPKIVLEDLPNQNNQAKQGLFDKGPYSIYYKDFYLNNSSDKLDHTKLFIVYTKKDYMEIRSKIYMHLFTYSTIVIILSILIFNWYYRKKEKFKLKSNAPYTDKIRIDELFIDKQKDNPDIDRERKYG
jgi:hypothetical protein